MNGNHRMKYAVVLIAVFLSRAALAQDVTCGARTPHELRTVFTVAVGLNDAVHRAATGIATPQYRQLRAKFEHYEERQALPCAAAGVPASTSPSQRRRAGVATFDHPGLPCLSTKRSPDETDQRS